MYRLELRRRWREIDESKSDVINTVGVQQIEYIDRAVSSRLCVEDGVFYSHRRPVCVPEACHVTSLKIELILNEKLTTV